MLELGGRIGEAAMRHGIAADQRLDLSTGINPHGYPLADIPASAWRRLPEDSDALLAAARAYYGTPSLLTIAGSQAVIQALPRLRAQSRVAVAVLSYSEYAHAWDRGGHHVDSVSPDRIDERIEHSHVLIVCNPNHPIGRTFEMQQLLAWQGGWLIIDEAHADAGGTDSLAALSARLPRLIVFRSLGRFFGLAGARLRFVLAADPLLGRLREEPGPWYVSGPALKGAQATRQDTGGQRATRGRLAMDSKRLNSLLTRFDVAARGTALFQWWPHPCAAEMPHRLARHGMWVQLSSGPGCSSLRFGLPGSEDDWVRLERALLGDSMPSTRER